MVTPPEIERDPSWLMAVMYPWLDSRPNRCATWTWPAMTVPPTMLPLTVVSNPPAPAPQSSLKGANTVGNWTIRFFGTWMLKPLTWIEPPELYSVPAVQLEGVSSGLEMSRRAAHPSRLPITEKGMMLGIWAWPTVASANNGKKDDREDISNTENELLSNSWSHKRMLHSFILPWSASSLRFACFRYLALPRRPTP
jgi:hypothetical protein